MNKELTAGELRPTISDFAKGEIATKEEIAKYWDAVKKYNNKNEKHGK